MKNIDDRKKKYLAVWEAIHEWTVFRLSQKEELSTSEVKHLAEIQEKLQKSSDAILGEVSNEPKSSLDKLVDVLNKSRKNIRK